MAGRDGVQQGVTRVRVARRGARVRLLQRLDLVAEQVRLRQADAAKVEVDDVTPDSIRQEGEARDQPDASDLDRIHRRPAQVRT